MTAAVRKYATRAAGALAALACGLLAAVPAAAEVGEVRIAKGFGIGYLPLIVMEDEKLYEKHAKAAGLSSEAKWLVIDGGTTQAQLLIGGNLEVSSGGLGPLVAIWGRTKGNLDVQGMASINSMPLHLNTTNPAVKTVRDFTDKDRIALPVIKSSIQAVVLQMQAEKVFGEGKHDVLDRLTVSMAHPDGTAALLSGGTEVTAHLTAPPFSYQQLKDKRVRNVFSSYDVVGGSHSFNLIWTTKKFRQENPKTYAAFLAALQEAMEKINADKKKYAQVFVRFTKSKLEPAFIEEMMNDPQIRYTMAPEGTMRFAEFLHKIGRIKEKPASWKDMFFPEIHNLSGS